MKNILNEEQQKNIKNYFSYLEQAGVSLNQFKRNGISRDSLELTIGVYKPKTTQRVTKEGILIQHTLPSTDRLEFSYQRPQPGATQLDAHIDYLGASASGEPWLRLAFPKESREVEYVLVTNTTGTDWELQYEGKYLFDPSRNSFKRSSFYQE